MCCPFAHPLMFKNSVKSFERFPQHGLRYYVIMIMSVMKRIVHAAPRKSKYNKKFPKKSISSRNGFKIYIALTISYRHRGIAVVLGGTRSSIVRSCSCFLVLLRFVVRLGRIRSRIRFVGIELKEPFLCRVDLDFLQ